jgi:Subtilase family
MMTPNRTKHISSQRTGASPWGELELILERCEARLVFSAIPIVDVSNHLLLDDTLESSVADWCVPADLSHSPTSASNPPLNPLSSAAHNQSGWTDVQRLFGLRGENQTVAVIDSGVAWDHVALGKGFGPGYRVVGGWDFAENDAMPYDDAPAGYHGTHVSGIIAADDPTRSGVAPGVDLVALRVFDDNGKGQLSWTESALRWVHQNRNAFESPITTVNLSLGSTWNSDSVPGWGTLEDELLQLQQDGIVVVASAGNSFKQYNAPGLSYPAASPYVIPVASADANGQLSDFSQRHERAIAAPGRQITSTIPDHVLGSDGIIDDWSTANGTSMAAPYVAGSAVLIREAMEMVGRTGVTPQEIYQWMSDTADDVWDGVTKATYERLNLGKAIGNLFPTDDVGGSWNDARFVELQSSFTTNGWINTLGDHDAFKFTAPSDGVLNVAAQSAWLEGSSWSLWVDGQATPVTDPSAVRLNIEAGRSYAFAFSDADQVGNYALQWSFSPQNDSTHDNGSNGNDGGRQTPTNLGAIDYRELSGVAGQTYTIDATRDGTLTVIMEANAAKSGVLELRNSQGTVIRDSTIENGQWRIDVETTQGATWTIQTPSSESSNATLVLANVLQRSSTNLKLIGTEATDFIELDLNQGLRLQFGKAGYRFSEGTIQDLNIDLGSGSDTVRVLGSKLAEKIDLHPEHSLIENQQIQIDLISAGQVDYAGGGGPDRVYLYGSTGSDTLTARSRDVELAGPGFRFHVEQVERTYVNAEQGGEDIAYFYDSAGDDRLSVRPQFSSMSGKDFFNYASGMERVYAYSNAGGVDTAILYDSAAIDTFYTSGDVASVVGAGFFSYTRYFENVEAVSSAGGKDIASIYANDRNSLLVGSDITGYQDSNWSRLARGFSSAKTYIDNQLVETKALAESYSLMIESDASKTIHESLATYEATGIIEGPRVEFELDTLTDLSVNAKDISETRENSSLPMITLDEEEASEIAIDFDWVDLQRERRVLDEIFARF